MNGTHSLGCPSAFVIRSYSLISSHKIRFGNCLLGVIA